MSLTSIAASVMILAPPGETSITKHSRFVIPLSTVIQAGRLRTSRRGSRGVFARGLSTVMMSIRRWIFNCDRLTQFPLHWLVSSRRIAEPVIGCACARPVGDAPQDEVSNPHGEERIFARLGP